MMEKFATLGLVIFLAAWLAVWVWEGGGLRRFKGLSRSGKFFAGMLLLAAIVYGSVKTRNGFEGAGRATVARTMASRETQSAGGGFTENQVRAGFVLAEVRTGEAHDFALPANANVHEPWLKRGASEDGFWLDAGRPFFKLGAREISRVYVSASGTLAFEGVKSSPTARWMPDGTGLDFMAVFHARLGIVPEGNWDAAGLAESLFWWAETGKGSLLLTWRNALLNRETDSAVSFQAELFPSGDFVFRYDAPQSAGVLAGAQNNGGGESFWFAARGAVTTARWVYVADLDFAQPDEDGDGLPTWDEVFVHHTNPRLADSDGDGIGDWDEVSHGTNPRDPDEDGDGVPDGAGRPSQWLAHPLWAANAGTTNVVITLREPVPADAAAAIVVGGLSIPLREAGSWSLGLRQGAAYDFLLATSGNPSVKLSLESSGGGFFMDDPQGVFALSGAAPRAGFALLSAEPPGGGTDAGAGTMAFPKLELELADGEEGRCLHGDLERKFVATLEPNGWATAKDAATITAAGGTATLNANGTITLRHNGHHAAYPGTADLTVSLRAPWLAQGSLEATETIHLCAAYGGFCFACGRRHGVGKCAHEAGCEARTSYANACTCPPLFVRVNSDDDNADGAEDRREPAPPEADNDLTGCDALGVAQTCCCGALTTDDVTARLTEVSPNLRLWSGDRRLAAGASISAFTIEAADASPLIEGSRIRWDVRDSDGNTLRSITRPVTAANLQLKPDYNDDRAINLADTQLAQKSTGNKWFLRRRDKPYRIDLQNEIPADTALQLTVIGNTHAPVLRATANGPALFAPNIPPQLTTAHLDRDTTQTLWLDTSSCTNTSVSLTYTLLATNTTTSAFQLTHTQPLTILDATLPERWHRPADTITYSIPGAIDIGWDLYDIANRRYLKTQRDPVFDIPHNLPFGDYRVYADLHELYENGATPFSTNGLLHIVDVVIEEDARALQCGRTNHISVALDMAKSSGPAHWKIEPVLPDGARLHASTSANGATALLGTSNLWISAGNIATNYTLTAIHPNATHINDTVPFTAFTVELTNLKFNHDTAASTHDAINLRYNHAKWFDVQHGEWNTGGMTNHPVCYTTNTLATVKARFTVTPASVTNVVLRARVANAFPVLGSLAPAGITFSGGVSVGDAQGYVTLTAATPTPGEIRTRDETLEWLVSAANGATFDETCFTQTGPHKTYNILREPARPWDNEFGNPCNAWADVLDLACDWATLARDEAETVAQITTKAYSEFGKKYDSGKSHTTDYSCKLTKLLKDNWADCKDMSAVVYLFTRATGGNAVNIRRVYGPFYTHKILPMNDTWTSYRWHHHQFAWLGGTASDACVMVNKNNPYVPANTDYTIYQRAVWDGNKGLLTTNDWRDHIGGVFYLHGITIFD